MFRELILMRPMSLNAYFQKGNCQQRAIAYSISRGCDYNVKRYENVF